MKDLNWLCMPIIILVIMSPTLFNLYTEHKQTLTAIENGYEQVYDAECDCKLWKKE